MVIDFNQILNTIKTAVLGIEVRQAIHDGLKYVNDTGTEAKTAADNVVNTADTALRSAEHASLLAGEAKNTADGIATTANAALINTQVLIRTTSRYRVNKTASTPYTFENLHTHEVFSMGQFAEVLASGGCTELEYMTTIVPSGGLKNFQLTHCILDRSGEIALNASFSCASVPAIAYVAQGRVLVDVLLIDFEQETIQTGVIQLTGTGYTA